VAGNLQHSAGARAGHQASTRIRLFPGQHGPNPPSCAAAVGHGGNTGAERQGGIIISHQIRRCNDFFKMVGKSGVERCGDGPVDDFRPMGAGGAGAVPAHPVSAARRHRRRRYPAFLFPFRSGGPRRRRTQRLRPQREHSCPQSPHAHPWHQPAGRLAGELPAGVLYLPSACGRAHSGGQTRRHRDLCDQHGGLSAGLGKIPLRHDRRR